VLPKSLQAYINMKGKYEYKHREDVIRGMKYIIGEVVWTNEVLPNLFRLSIQEINRIYQNARDQAIAFGVDITSYPRRLKWKTKGLEIVERVPIY